MSRGSRLLPTRGTLRSGVLTGVAQAALSLAAAGAGALLAQKFGRSAETRFGPAMRAIGAMSADQP